MGIKRRKNESSSPSNPTSQRIYVDLDLDTLCERFGSEEAYMDHLRSLYPDMGEDEVEEILGENSRPLVEDHPYISLKPAMKLGDVRGNPKVEKRIRRLVKREAKGDKATQDIVWGLCQRIDGAGGDWSLAYDRFRGCETIGEWTQKSYDARARLLIAMGEDTASLLFKALSDDSDEVNEELLGNYEWRSQSSTTARESTTAPSAA